MHNHYLHDQNQYHHCHRYHRCYPHLDHYHYNFIVIFVQLHSIKLFVKKIFSQSTLEMDTPTPLSSLKMQNLWILPETTFNSHIWKIQSRPQDAIQHWQLVCSLKTSKCYGVSFTWSAFMKWYLVRKSMINILVTWFACAQSFEKVRTHS